MKGIELAKKFFIEHGLPTLKKEVPEFLDYMACGLVGEGSECFNLDDEISIDHDFGPGFCIWIPQKIYSIAKEKIELAIDKMPSEFMGYKRNYSGLSDKRVGLFSIEEFYYKYTKSLNFPISNAEWMKIPESFLATVTNGEVFLDNHGEFTRIRNYLLSFYPTDIVRKKLAAYLAIMAQSGQYNLQRSYDRDDFDAYYFSKAEFIKSTYGALFLLAHHYKPYYKLTARKLKSLNYYPKDIFIDINNLQKNNNIEDNIILIERICKYLSDIINVRYNIFSPNTFLITIAQLLQESIGDDNIRKLHIMKGNENA